MSSSNPHLGRELQAIRGYGVAVLSVLAALLISHWPVFHLESAPVSLFLCAVMFSAWVGGAGPGFLATVLSALAFYYSFLPPHDSLTAKPGQIPRCLVFIVSALFVGSLSIAQRRTTQSLRRTRDDLNETVQELKKTNEALGKSEAYLAEAQTLSHTGSFGWNASTGQLFWSEETFRIFSYERTLKPTVQLALERVHLEDVHLVQEALDGASHGEDVDLEHRLVMPDGDPNPAMVIADVGPAHTNSPMRAIPTTPDPAVYKVLSRQVLQKLQVSKPDFTVTFTEDKKGFYINGRKFSMDNDPMLRVRLGSMQHWRIVNSTREVHPFHIHQIHFLAYAENGIQSDSPEWLDTVNVPDRNGTVDLIMDFTDPLIKGTSVFHCHLLSHEDKGMMAKIVFE